MITENLEKKLRGITTSISFGFYTIGCLSVLILCYFITDFEFLLLIM